MMTIVRASSARGKEGSGLLSRASPLESRKLRQISFQTFKQIFQEGADFREPALTMKTRPGSLRRGSSMLTSTNFRSSLALLAALVARLQRGAENVAERSAGIGRPILGDRFLLFGDFQRLDRHRDLTRLAVELRDPRVNLLAASETLGPLIATVAGEFGALDEGRQVGAGDLHFDAAFLDLDHLAGHHRALAQFAAFLAGGFRLVRIGRELLDAQRDALFLDIDV